MTVSQGESSADRESTQQPRVWIRVAVLLTQKEEIAFLQTHPCPTKHTCSLATASSLHDHLRISLSNFCCQHPALMQPLRDISRASVPPPAPLRLHDLSHSQMFTRKHFVHDSMLCNRIKPRVIAIGSGTTLRRFHNPDEPYNPCHPSHLRASSVPVTYPAITRRGPSVNIVIR